MFEVLLVVCALDVNQSTNCLRVADVWGPYRTEENCKIRVKQMLKDISSDAAINSYVFDSLGNPVGIIPYVIECKKTGGTGV